MKVIFFGTSSFAVPSLKGLARSSHEILLVITQPDRKKGRHLRLTAPAVKEVATGLDIPVYQPIDASSDESIKQLKKINADLFVVVSFGQILSERLLAAPKKFSINLHGSLLPKYRGAAPINWAIINGEKKTGVTVFKLEKKMDAGDIILEKEVEIKDDDNTITLSEKLAQVGAKVLTEAVGLIEKDKAIFKRQDETIVSFAPKLKKGDGLINWELRAIDLHNRVRGLLPWPGAFTIFKDKMLKIIETQVLPCPVRYLISPQRCATASNGACENKEAACGQIVGIENGLGLLVKTKEGYLVIKRLQLEGSRPMGFEEFLRGHRLKIGDILCD